MYLFPVNNNVVDSTGAQIDEEMAFRCGFAGHTREHQINGFRTFIIPNIDDERNSQYNQEADYQQPRINFILITA